MFWIELDTNSLKPKFVRLKNILPLKYLLPLDLVNKIGILLEDKPLSELPPRFLAVGQTPLPSTNFSIVAKRFFFDL